MKCPITRYNSIVLLRLAFGLFFALVLIPACKDDDPNGDETPQYPVVDRLEKLPSDIPKQGPETDEHPPILHSDEFEDPVPLAAGINTSGAEDSPFILPDGNTMYFFFTPDVRKSAEQQLFDSVSGVWKSVKVNQEWETAERVWLQDPGKLALDGAVAIQGDEMWFASAREGYVGVNMFTAGYADNKWTNWKYSGDRLMKELQIGEVHLHGNDLYFHSDRPGGNGALDIWVTTRSGDVWSDPVNIPGVNSTEADGWPYISQDGKELWLTRVYLGAPAIFRSINNAGAWSEPELILSQFAGECTLDNEGNLYFVHHYYKENVMIEADICVAYKK